jgi:hypothetical protein
MTHQQLQLDFDRPTVVEASAPSSNAAATRRAAGVAIRPDARRLRARVLEYLVGRGPTGGTDEEIQSALGLSGDTERPRRRELQQAGLVVDSGQVRPTSSGRLAVAWIATAAAIRTAEPTQ